MVHYTREIVIIGSGIAGLAAACELAKQGQKPLMIDAGPPPSHRICGEFFSSESLPWIKSLGFEPKEKIKAVELIAKEQSYQISFIPEAGAFSHSQLDPSLVEWAEKRGTEFWFNTPVESITSGNPFTLSLLNKGSIKADQVIVASGRNPFFSNSPSRFPYIGFKTYFSGLPLSEKLMMFSFPGAYLGVLPLNNETYNVACLSCHTHLSPQQHFEMFCKSSASFKALFSESKQMFEKWMETKIPPFGFKKNPNLPNLYFIGDALGTIPPATGAGLSLALKSGVTLANLIQEGKAGKFQKEWQKNQTRQLLLGKWIHTLLLHPLTLRMLWSIVPSAFHIPEALLRNTRTQE